MPSRPGFAAALLVKIVILGLALPVATTAQDPSPTPPADPVSWPSGDELRRGLQDIGFVFRVEPETGDWRGWAPATSTSEAHHLTLAGAGTTHADAAFDFDLLPTETPAGELDATLTAAYEVAARLPLAPRTVELARDFLLEGVLTQPPERLEPCYLAEDGAGAALVAIDADTGRVTLRLALRATLDASLAADDAAPDPGSCAEMLSEEESAALEPSSERLTIRVIDGDSPRFEPAEIVVEGTLVTLILSFVNDTDAEQRLTFDAPLEADTGPIAPGETRLIVVRQLEPGDYPFRAATRTDGTGTHADGLRGSIRVEEPLIERDGG